MGRDRLIWRGEVYDVDRGHPSGHAPALTRPTIVVSADVLNNGAGNLVVIVPVGSTSYGEADPYWVPSFWDTRFGGRRRTRGRCMVMLVDSRVRRFLDSGVRDTERGEAARPLGPRRL